MSIQRTAVPGGVENLLCYVGQQDLVCQAEEVPPPLTKLSESTFWQQLFTQGLAPWPVITDASVRMAQVPDGCLFTVEDEQGLLVIGGVGLTKAGIAWEKLTETVDDIRQEAAASVQRSAGGKELLADWSKPVVPPSGGDWLTLVPMIGLRYYVPDIERIMDLAGALGKDLLTLCKRQALPA